MALIGGLARVEDGDAGDVGSLCNVFELLRGALQFERNREPVWIHLGQVLLVLFFRSVAVDDEDLEFGSGCILVRLLHEFGERLHETLTRWTVLRGEENQDVRY